MSISKWLPALIAACAAPALALADTYKIDPDHTYPSLEVPHMGISIFRGKFTKSAGKVTLDRAAQSGSVDITIDSSSVDFGHEKLKEHLLSKDFLDAQKYPTITYKGPLKFSDGVPKEVDGQLTLLGVTKPVKLTVNSFKCIEHPFYKKEVCGADAEGEFNRADFGMTKYAEGELGKVRVKIQVEGIKES